MVDREVLWERSGLRPGQIVECVVLGHRDRYGIDVGIGQEPNSWNAFIDLVLLVEKGELMTPELFPEVGTTLSAVVVDFTPTGELRLNARPSALEEHRRNEGAEE